MEKIIHNVRRKGRCLAALEQSVGGPTAAATLAASSRRSTAQADALKVGQASCLPGERAIASGARRPARVFRPRPATPTCCAAAMRRRKRSEGGSGGIPARPIAGSCARSRFDFGLGLFHGTALFSRISGILWLIILKQKIRNIKLSNQIKPNHTKEIMKPNLHKGKIGRLPSRLTNQNNLKHSKKICTIPTPTHSAPRNPRSALLSARKSYIVYRKSRSIVQETKIASPAEFIVTCELQMLSQMRNEVKECVLIRLRTMGFGHFNAQTAGGSEAA